MARDWRRVALAALAATAVASVCASGPSLEAQQSARTSKTKGKAPPPEAKNEDGEDGDSKTAAKRKRQDPAEAQRAVDAAGKLLQTGKAEQAAQTLTLTLAGGNLPPAIMARALYLRGIAYRQQGKPAQAIADLTSALWLKGGLGTEDRADALKQRAGAYADAGLTETGATVAAAPSNEAKEHRERPGAKGWGAVTTSTEIASPQSAQSGQGGNWFKNWFNAWSPPAAQANASPPAPPAATASIDKPDPSQRPQAGPTPRIAGAWSSKTEVHAAASPQASRPSKTEGKYRVQLATVRSHREAEALAAKAKRALGALAAGEPEIDQAVVGNMGSFYRVRIGPFTNLQETQAICGKAKDAGFDCLAVTQ